MYGDVYHGLPSELRLMIWRAVLADAFPVELRLGDLSHRAKLRLPRSEPPFAPEPKHKIESTALTILQLNHETRREALTLFQHPCTILDLSNAKESAQLTGLLDNIPPWLPHIVKEVIIDRSQIKDPCGGNVRDVSIDMAENLYALMDSMPHLDQVVFTIDACRWQEDRNSYSPWLKRDLIREALQYLWRVEDTEEVLSRLESGKLRKVKLFISHHLSLERRFYHEFVDVLRDLDRAQVKKRRHLRVVAPFRSARAKKAGLYYSFVQKWHDCGFTIVTLTKK